jgi:hypothetical protein
MSDRSRIAVIRFGLGPRLGEPLPADPDAWLARPARRPRPAAGGPDDGRRAPRPREQTALGRQLAAGVEMAQAMPPAQPGAAPAAAR